MPENSDTYENRESTSEERNDLRTSEARRANRIERMWKEQGSRLTSIRESSGYTQPQMAKAIDVSKTTYGRLERGEREIGALQLALLGSAGWNLNWVVRGELPERLGTEKQGVSGAKLDPEMMQKAVESAIGVFQRFNKLPSASQLARASVLLYLLFTDNEPETAQPVDQLLARIMGEPADAEPSETR